MVNTAFEYRRLEYDVGIGYGDDIDRARGLILEAVRGTEGVLAEPAVRNTDVPTSGKMADTIRHMSGSKQPGAEGE